MPPTFRGRFGQFAISVIQRLLWWYTAPLRSFARVTGQLLGAHSDVVEQLKDAQEDHNQKIQRLEARLYELEQLSAHSVSRLEAQLEAETLARGVIEQRLLSELSPIPETLGVIRTQLEKFRRTRFSRDWPRK